MFNDLLSNDALEYERRYQVISLPDSFHKLGCSEDGMPKFFVEVCEERDVPTKNLNAELLTVEYDTQCNVIDGDTHIDNHPFTIITLRSENEQLQKTFIDIFMLMLKMLPAKPSKKSIASKIENMLSIFAKLKKRPIHRLQGLWAEMLLIEQSKNPTVTASAWHCAPDSKYDFTMGRDKIEVKSTSSENRLHHFSLDQLNPSENSKLLVCSIIVRESGKDDNGLSVFNLYDKISAKIKDDEIRLHIYEVMLETLGTDFNSAQKKYFDYSSACDNLALYEHTDIPHIEKKYIPEHVTDVKFCADLSHLTDARIKGFEKGDSSLFRALY